MFLQALFWVLLMFVCASFADADEYSDMAEHLNVTRDDLVRMHVEFEKMFPSDLTIDHVQGLFAEKFSLEGIKYEGSLMCKDHNILSIYLRISSICTICL